MGSEAYIRRLESGIGDWVVRHRWWIILVSLLIVVGAGSGIQFLTFNRDLRVFFSEENPQLQALEALEQTYTKSENVMFALAPADGDVFSRDTLAAVEQLTERSWQMPSSTRVESITNFQHVWVEGDDLFVDNLVRNAHSLSETEIKDARNIALSEPLLINRLLSPSGHATGVWVSIVLPGESLAEVVEVTTFARKLAAELREEHPGLAVYLSGTVIVDNAYGEVVQGDLSTLVPAMLGMLVFITALALRSLTGTVAALFVIVMAMVTGMGLAGWLGFSWNPASATAPTIILTLALADSVHILVTMFHEMRLGKSKHEAIIESLRVNLRAVSLTSMTTAIGFLGLNFSDAPPFRDFGNIVAMGVIAAFAYSILFLPSLMAVMPARRRLTEEIGHRSSGPLDRLANFVTTRHRLLLWALLPVTVFLAAGALRNELDDEWAKYFGTRYDIRQAIDFIAENISGTDIIEYSLDSGTSGGIHDPTYLATVEAFADWYRRQPKVTHVSTIGETIKRLNKTMHGGESTYYRIPEQRELAAQYLLLYELSLPFGLDLNNQINVDRSATRMTVFLRGTTLREVREADANARDWLRNHAPTSMYTYGTSTSVIWAHLSERNIKSLIGASLAALAIISGMLILALRSFRIGIISLIPNLTPALMAFGLWGFTVGQVGLGLSVVVPLTLGIVVDDTIHFLSKYLRARREDGLDPAGAVRYAFHTVGTAIWVTTVALVAGFLILTLSGYKVNSDMGLMAAVTISLALATDFLLLPALLMAVDPKTKAPDSVVHAAAVRS